MYIWLKCVNISIEGRFEDSRKTKCWIYRYSPFPVSKWVWRYCRPPWSVASTSWLGWRSLSLTHSGTYSWWTFPWQPCQQPQLKISSTSTFCATGVPDSRGMRQSLSVMVKVLVKLWIAVKVCCTATSLFLICTASSSWCLAAFSHSGWSIIPHISSVLPNNWAWVDMVRHQRWYALNMLNSPAGPPLIHETWLLADIKQPCHKIYHY